MNLVVGATYHFQWHDYELLAVFEGYYESQAMFREPESGLRFLQKEAGSPSITEYDAAAAALKAFKPDLEKFAPTFMGFRTKQD